VNDSIFISWSMPDKETFERFVRRLEDVGLTVNEYSRRIHAGEEIRKWVGTGIAEAKIVIVFLSQAALGSEWIQYETAIAADKYELGSLDRLIVIRIGRLPPDTLPGKLHNDRIVFFDTSAPPSEKDLIDLVSHVQHALDREAPLVVPCASFAMTLSEFDEIATATDPDSVVIRQHIVDLCRRFGMPDKPEIWQQIRERYGTASEDFSPFPDVGTLSDMVQAVLRSVNNRRIVSRRPIYLRWIKRTELQTENTLKDLWRNGPSLLIVDSISALHPTVASELLRLPRPRDEGRAPVVCLPPYTRHTGSVEQMIEQLLGILLSRQTFLYETVRDWRERDNPPALAFDIPSAASMRRWLADLLMTLDADDGTPLLEYVLAMTGGKVPRQVPHVRGVPGLGR
jgi:hypothetical protein